MSNTDKIIIETYAGLFEGLSSLNKIELIETLSKLLKSEVVTREKAFYKSFGAFRSEKSAEDIIHVIKSSRKFRAHNISLT